MADITYTIEVALGGTLTDVTDLVDGGVFNAGGGRHSQFDRFSAGRCTFTLEDTEGDYIPNAGGLWSGETWVGREVKVSAVAAGLTNVLWRGHIEDIGVDIVGHFHARLTISAVDPLARLGRTIIDAGTAFSQELSSVRIGNVLALSEVDSGYFGADEKDIAAGDVTLQADSDAGGNTLQYLQLVEQSEGGRLYLAQGGPIGGVLTFRPRTGNSDDSGLTFQDTDGGSGSLVDGGTAATAQSVVYSDTYSDTYGSPSWSDTWDGGTAADPTTEALDGGDATTRYDVPYETVDVAFGSQQLINRVSYTREGGSEQTAEDVESQARYGIRTTSESGLLNNSDADVLELAQLRLARQSQPSRHIEGLTVLLDVLTDDQAAFVLGLTVGDQIKVVASPPGYETNGTLTSTVRVENLEHRVTDDTHLIRMGLTTLADEFGGAVDGGDAATVSFVDTWDGGDAAAVTFARALDGGTAIFG